jgi:hypothetical protein
MKVKVTYCAYSTKEVEISDEFQPLADPKYIYTYSDGMYDKVVQAVEKVMGIPFGDGEGCNEKYIVSVVDSATDETMLEW